MPRAPSPHPSPLTPSPHPYAQVEEKIIERAQKKLYLDAAVIQQVPLTLPLTLALTLPPTPNLYP